MGAFSTPWKQERNCHHTDLSGCNILSESNSTQLWNLKFFPSNVRSFLG